MQNSIKQPSAKVNSIYTGNYWGTSIVLRHTRSTTDQIFCIRQILGKKNGIQQGSTYTIQNIKKSIWFGWNEDHPYSDFFLPQHRMCKGPLLRLPRWHTLSRTPLDDWSAQRRDLYPATHNTHKRERERETSMPPAGFVPEIPANERP